MGKVIKLNTPSDIFNEAVVKNYSIYVKKTCNLSNALILEKLDSKVPFIQEIASYLNFIRG